MHQHPGLDVASQLRLLVQHAKELADARWVVPRGREGGVEVWFCDACEGARDQAQARDACGFGDFDADAVAVPDGCGLQHGAYFAEDFFGEMGEDGHCGTGDMARIDVTLNRVELIRRIECMLK